MLGNKSISYHFPALKQIEDKCLSCLLLGNKLFQLLKEINNYLIRLQDFVWQNYKWSVHDLTCLGPYWEGLGPGWQMYHGMPQSMVLARKDHLSTYICASPLMAQRSKFSVFQRVFHEIKAELVGIITFIYESHSITWIHFMVVSNFYSYLGLAGRGFVHTVFW